MTQSLKAFNINSFSDNIVVNEKNTYLKQKMETIIQVSFSL